VDFDMALLVVASGLYRLTVPWWNNLPLRMTV
jgi:hypothetical protein